MRPLWMGATRRALFGRFLDKFPSGPLPVAGLIVVAVVFGSLCRVSQYAANTSLWHDESFVALNVLQKSFAGLLGPLAWNEAAPPGFLFGEKLVVVWLGRSEYALRLIPLVGGLVGLVCFALLAHRTCEAGWARSWAVLLMAASAKLIVQSNEVKHFTLDLLFAVLLTWSATRIASLSRPTRPLLAWETLGAFAVWLSYASLFVFAGTSMVLGFRALRVWRWPGRAAYVLANLVVLASVGLLLNPIRAQRAGPVLTFWTKGEAFPDTTSLLALIYWLGRSHLGLINYFWRDWGALLLLLVLLGSVRWWRLGRKTQLLCLLLPVLAALAASFMHYWPFGGNQHMVFAGPAVLLLAGEGSEIVRLKLLGWKQWASWTFLAFLLLPWTTNAVYRLVFPRQRHEVRPVIQFVQRHLEPDDQILVFDPATVEFYTGRSFRNTAVLPRARVWYVSLRAGYKNSTFSAPEVLDRLAARRQPLRAIEEYGAAAYLFGPEQ